MEIYDVLMHVYLCTRHYDYVFILFVSSHNNYVIIIFSLTNPNQTEQLSEHTCTNQSMVQQFTSEGNIRQRDLKASPTGLIHSTMCSFSRTREMKYWNT